ncbi:MAG TPA: tetratricopeptide repeat protein, partial [Steroidobacteraceae bacterium]|nr:tetratricopeptide repeat protein [Steroidobacteraceae bacterium]
MIRSRTSILAALVALAFASTAGAQAQKPKPAPTLKDLEGRKVEVKPDKPVDTGQAKAMANYREFLSLKKGDPALRAEAMRRLGDLNLEAADLERGEGEVAMGLGNAEAVQLYSMLLSAYPDYARADAVLYQLARAYESNAEPLEALGTLDQMVTRYPQSRLIDEAQFRRGEILFSEKRYADAERAYGDVVRRGDGSTFYEQSLYKRGWSLFKLARNDESLDTFGKLLDRKLIDRGKGDAVIDPQSLTRAERELLDDTFRVTSITFSYEDGAESVDEYVAAHGTPPYSYLLYSSLGDLYITKERYQDAAQTYEAFVKRDPIDPNAPLLQVRAIEAYRKGGFASLVLTGKQDFVERYGFGTAFWAGRDRAQFPAVVTELKTSVKELAKHYHSTAQKSKKAGDYGMAARWYRSYLDWFPQEPESADTNFLLAEALYESLQFREATLEYERTAYQYPVNARSAEAAYAALLAYDQQEKLLTGIDKATWHVQSVESGLKFATTYPQHKEAPNVLTRSARELFELKDYDRAIATAEQVLALVPPVDLQKQRVARTVIAHGRFDQGRYAEAEAAYREAIALKPDGASLYRGLGMGLYFQGKYAEAEAALRDAIRLRPGF